jgi:hypothetical protein
MFGESTRLPQVQAMLLLPQVNHLHQPPLLLKKLEMTSHFKNKKYKFAISGTMLA